MGRYEIMFGPNTNQWWIYDNEDDIYIDPPAAVLDAVEEYSADEQEDALLQIVEMDPEWLYDENARYDDIEI